MVVSHDALHKFKLSEPTPVIIDHHDDRVIGRVRDVWVANDVDYGARVRKWHFASCELDEKPDWLRRGSGVSWSYNPLHQYTALGTDTKVLTSCIIREVSILSPSVSPAEPLAHVALVRQVEPKPAAGERFIYGDGTLIRRYFPNAVVAVGGVPMRTGARKPLRRSGADWVVDHPDGSATIYCGPDGYQEALQDGVVR
jgi:hypothetical protein